MENITADDLYVVFGGLLLVLGVVAKFTPTPKDDIAVTLGRRLLDFMKAKSKPNDRTERTDSPAETRNKAE